MKRRSSRSGRNPERNIFQNRKGIRKVIRGSYGIQSDGVGKKTAANVNERDQQIIWR